MTSISRPRGGLLLARGLLLALGLLLATSATALAAAPTVSITSEPASLTNQTSASFAFSTTNTNVTVCSIDGGSWTDCTSPTSYSSLTNGNHTFTVAAFGANYANAIVSYAWQVDTTPPTAPTTVTATLAGYGTVTVNWSGASDPNGLSLMYVIYRNLAGVAFSSGSSFTDTPPLGAATYTYTVVAYDAAGNHSQPVNAVALFQVPDGMTTRPDSTNWTLAFDDEFTGGSLNTSVWSPNWEPWQQNFPGDITKPDNSNDLSCADPAAATVSGGYLHLLATSKSCTSVIRSPDGKTTSDGPTYSYDSAVISTAQSFNFTGGYMEARINVPATSSGYPANFPAFWATNLANWPTNGEIDVMEGLNSCGGSTTPGVSCLGYQFIYGTLSNVINPGAAVSPYSMTGWHTLGAYWVPGQSITYYYDGQQVGQITTGITSQPMFLVLDNAVDTTWGGDVVTPADLQVADVRVWQ